MVVLHKSTSKEIGSLGKAFHQFDANRDGFITFEEFEEGLGVDCGYDLEELMEMFHGADLDGTGVLHYTEFLAATIEARGVIGRERLAEAFDRLDSDDSGYISTEVHAACIPIPSLQYPCLRDCSWKHPLSRLPLI